MSMQTSSLAALALPVVLLGACSGDAGQAQGGGGETAAAAGGQPLLEVPCALRGEQTYARMCAVERASDDGRTVLIVRHPDGGFRRLEEVDNGRSYAAADGADTAEVAVDKDKLAVTVDGDHYLFPLPPGMTAEPEASPRPAAKSPDAPAR